MSDTGGRWDDLAARIVGGGAVAAIGVLGIWAGGLVFHILIALVCGIIVWELARMLEGGRGSVPLGIVAGLAVLIAGDLPPAWALLLILGPGIVGVAQIEKDRVVFAIYVVLILLAGFGMMLLRDQFGALWMVWLVLVVIASDIGGYFGGRIIGGPKIWPKVSPKKTWSGTIAGWVGAAIVAIVLIAMYGVGAELIPISIAVAIAGQLGDVAESAVKRRAGVKDSSSLIPGHGGLFDRFDAMLGASVFLLLVEQIINFPPVVGG